MRAVLLAGLGYGDEGKGSIVDFLTRDRQARTVVRYNGGAQCAHNVVLPDGTHHTFSQFGSGSFVPGVETFLSRFVLVNPGALLNEGAHLRDALGLQDIFTRICIDGNALVTNPFQVAANRVREIARGNGRHGSCGLGIGETMSDSLEYGDRVLFVKDLWDSDRTVQKLLDCQNRKIAELQEVVEASPEARACPWWDVINDGSSIDAFMPRYREFLRSGVRITNEDYLQERMRGSTTIFEGGQGVLLDQDYGFQPYTTWSDTTFGNADKILEGFEGEIERVGVIRAYATRHGAGPFVTEDPELDYPEPHNKHDQWQEGWRVGHFDLLAFRYALQVLGYKVDTLAMTHLDRIEEPPNVCVHYDFEGPPDTGIPGRPRFPHDPEFYEAQVQRTERLLTAKPMYRNVALQEQSRNPGIDLLNTVWRHSGAEFSNIITSWGPTHEDKNP